MGRTQDGIFALVTRVVAVAMTALLLASSTACGNSMPNAAPLRYLYATVDQVFLMDGANQVAAVDREMGPYDDPRMSEAAWTGNGKYVGFLAIPQTIVLDAAGNDVGSDRQSLTIIDAQSGKVANYPCAVCTQVVAVGDRFWVLQGSHFQVRQLDPAAAQPGFATITLSGLTRTRPALMVPTLFGGPEGAALITQSFDSGVVDNRERRALYLADAEGVARPVGDYPMIGRVQAATATSTDQAGHMALTSTLGTGHCSSRTSSFWTLSADTPQLAATDMTAMRPAQSQSSNFGVKLSQPWWGKDGHFHVAAARWTCTGPTQRIGSDAGLIKNILPWRIFRLDGSRWVDENIEALASVELSADTRVDHHSPTCAADKTINPQQDIPDHTPVDQVCLSGPLVLTTPAGTKQINGAAVALWPQPPTG